MRFAKEAKEIIRTLEENRFYVECPCCGESILLKEAGLFYLDDFTPEWEEGRKEAQRVVRRIDPIFTPRKLDPDDAKVIFDPIDYIVFNGMKAPKPIKNIILLDGEGKGKDHGGLQKSIEKVVEHENYEWQTLRVQEDGKIKVE